MRDAHVPDGVKLELHTLVPRAHSHQGDQPTPPF